MNMHLRIRAQPLCLEECDPLLKSCPLSPVSVCCLWWGSSHSGQRDAAAGVMGGTKTPSRDEQAEDWTLVHSLEHSMIKGTGTHFLPLRNSHVQDKKLGHEKKDYFGVRYFNLKTSVVGFDTKRECFLIPTSSSDTRVSGTCRTLSSYISTSCICIQSIFHNAISNI